MGGASLIVRYYNDKRLVVNEAQKKVKALIIHQRYYSTTLMGNVNVYMSLSDNVCVECTIIEDNYNVRPEKMYDPALITKYIMKSQINIVINLL